MPNIKVLITDASGFIGSIFSELCVELGYNVKAFDHCDPNNNLDWIEWS